MKLVGIFAAILALAGCPNQARNDSIAELALANKALDHRQFEEAIVHYDKATERNRDNHLAWYGLGEAWAAKGDWKKAADSFLNAVQLVDSQPMYQLSYGRALFE